MWRPCRAFLFDDDGPFLCRIVDPATCRRMPGPLRRGDPDRRSAVEDRRLPVEKAGGRVPVHRTRFRPFVCLRREQRYFKASPRPGTDMGRENGGPVGNWRNRSDALRNRGHVVAVPGGMVAFCPVPFAAETKIPGMVPSDRTVPGISSVFRIFMPDPGLRRSVLPARRHRSGQTYLLRSGRRLRTVAPACHISLSRISLSSASSFSR